MTWNPNPTVKIDGNYYTGEALWGASIVAGRSSIWEQPRAGYATIRIANFNNTDLGINANQEVRIEVDDSNGNPVRLFTGKVTDIFNTVSTNGNAGFVVIQQVSAVGVMAEMARTIIGDTSWAKEYDDDRMTRIFTDAGVTIDTVDTPGVYEFTSRSASAADSYTLATKYAQMAMGYIYETPDGKVGYANESRRFIDQRDNGYFTIPLNYILSNGMGSAKTIGEIMNDLVLTYKSNASVTSSDLSSQADYGLKAGKIDTEIETNTDAQTQADRYIALRAVPRTSLNSFTIQLDSDAVSSANLDELLAFNIGTAIEIDNLPIGIKNSIYRGFVEGLVWTINQYQVSLGLITSDSTLSVTPTRWQDVSATLRWQDVDPTIEWYNYA